MTDIIAYAIVAILFLIGAYLYWSACQSHHRAPIKMRRDTFKRYKNYIKKEFTNPETEAIVKEAGIPISGLFYQTIRYIVLITWLGALLYSKYVTGANISMPVIGWVAVFLATSPRRKILNQTSPFAMFVESVRKKNQHKYNLEIKRCLSQLKNMAVSRSNKSYSSSYLIEELSKYTEHTKPIFNRLLAYWYESRFDEAGAYFTEVIGTEEGSALVNLFKGLDGLKPTELITQVELYQNAAKERRKTYAQTMKEGKSNFIFVIVIGTGILILLNFLVVVLGIDAIDSFRSISTR